MGNKKTKEIIKDPIPEGNYPKVMLMGCANDGKSTIFRQIQKLNDHPDFQKIKEELEPFLLKNLISSLEKVYEYFYTRGHSFENHQIRV
jgi:hypothetical protein